MRTLTLDEMTLVAGAGDDCSSGDDGGNDEVNDYGGIKNTEGVGRELINIYEGLVEVTSHVIERVANALD